MRLRETIVSLLKAVADDDLVVEGTEAPQAANPEWLDLVADKVAAGSSNERLRSYLKNVGKQTWQHASWLTHATNANRWDAEIALANVSHLIAVYSTALIRYVRGGPKRCDECGSYRVGGGKCARCGWVDESYVPPEPEEVSEEEMQRRLSTPHTPSSDINTFMSPDDLDGRA